MDINALVKQLKNLDLSTYPKEEIQYLLERIGGIGMASIIFHEGKSIMRARPNYNGERFEKKQDYSFKPQELNKTYQRASTPNQTMFYGSVIPETLQPGELDNLRVIGLVETIPMLRDKTLSGYQKISFGKWVVQKDIHLLAVIQEEKYREASSYTKELANGYFKLIENTTSMVKENSLVFSTFLANEFSKEDIKGDYDYMISSLFTELIVKEGFDGIYYPSVRIGGRGFNVAITPEATSKMGLYVAGECSIYKLKDHTVLGNDAVVKLNGTEEEFKLEDIERHEKECLAQLGISSIDELTH